MRYFISILGLVVIVGAGYFAVAQYVTVAHGQSSLITIDQGSSNLNHNGAQVLDLLNRLQVIRLDGKVFADPDFMSLQDWTKTIDPQAVGRPNPYLPVGGAVAPVTSSTTKVTLPKKAGL